MGIEWDLPVGDPAGMRREAARLGLGREELSRIESRLALMVYAMTYRAPAGEQLFREVTSLRQRVRGALHQLDRLRERMLREAAELERAQAEVARVMRDLVSR